MLSIFLSVTFKYLLIGWLPERLLTLLWGETVLLNFIKDLLLVFLIISVLQPVPYLWYHLNSSV